MFQAEVFYNTGFTNINVPDSEETLLASGRHKTYPTMDILQTYFMDVIKLKVDSYKELRDADYLKLYDTEDDESVAFYHIDSYEMHSKDVAFVYVTMDSFLTAGGTKAIDFLDGITIRHHVHTDDDVFGAYCEDDDLLVPSQIEKIEWEYMYDEDYKQTGVLRKDAYLVSSIYNLSLINPSPISDIAVAASSSVDGEDNEVINRINMARVNPGTTKFSLPGCIAGSGVPVLSREWQDQGTVLYDYNCILDARTDVPPEDNPDKYRTIQEYVSKLRACGYQDCINASYKIPGIWVKTLNVQTSNVIQLSDGRIISLRVEAPMGRIVSITPEVYEDQTVLSTRIKSGDGAHNNRVNYGKHNRYTLCSPATGSITEALPEELYDYDVYHQSTSFRPKILATADTRPDGCPIFNFMRYKYQQNDPSLMENQGLMILDKAIFGARWYNNPIAAKYNVGSAQAAVNFAIAQREADYWASDAGQWVDNGGIGGLLSPKTGVKSAMKANADSQNAYNDVMAGDVRRNGYFTRSGIVAANQAYNLSASKALSEYALGVASNGLGHAARTVGNAFGLSDETMASIGLDPYSKAQYKRERDRQNERAIYNITTRLVQPDISFANNSQMQDLTGNGVIVIKHRPSDEDVQKFDRILNQFGYRITEPIAHGMMTNRQYYNYIEATGVDIKLTSSARPIPKSVKVDIANMFNTGIRIWHEKPGTHSYSVKNPSPEKPQKEV